MASMDRQKLVEDKKQELLRRIAEKKRTEQNKQSTASHPSPGNSQTASTGGAMFLNDGNFLARFQAMQQQQNTQTAASVDSSAVGSCGDVSDSRPFVSMKLTTVKKTTPAKPVASRPDIFEAAEDVEENVPPPEDKNILDTIEILAARVVRGGDKVEHAAMQSITCTNNPSFGFLFDVNSQEHKYYKNLVKCLRTGGAGAIKSENKEANSCSGERKRKRKSRWEAGPPASSPTGNDAAVAAALAVAAEIEHSVPMSNKEEEERQKQLREQQEIQQMYMTILAQRAACQGGTGRESARQNNEKPKYEYDSDEDVEGGTWEHKKRKAEMRKTEDKAQELTHKGKGKHHIGDFLPPEELKKFTAKVKYVKGESSLDEFDFSDYSEHKIKEDNIGYKMLQQAGWQEGMGLGSQGQGITAPVNKGRGPEDLGGLGEEKPGEIQREDDEFDLYRKRMMLAYRFRPNPLNNPRRPYY
ncbi:SURP and G-patch domain-containing protein 1-like [Montipora capricornis]|uniref:SURP and G-patch domain-containing protein 1-like n=1 Tax=Montipora capricornis TaxID=246305 RepID=UPI0035F1B8B7